MSGKRSKEEYLSLCADILCRTAYRMCKENYGKRKGDDPIDPKALKESCTAVKEAVAVVLSLDKNQDKANDGVRIVFGDGMEKIAE